MDKLSTKDLVLDISVNLGRVGRFLLEEKYDRAHQFTQEIKNQLQDLPSHLPEPLTFPINKTKHILPQLESTTHINIPLIDDCFTYSTLLQHRA